MTDPMTFSPFEQEVQAAIRPPDAGTAFVLQLKEQLRQAAARSLPAKPLRTRPFVLRRGWAAALVVLLALIITVAAIGPQRVYAQIMSLFGYIPDVGIVDTSAPIRVLAEPVSVTRDGITITVTSATLTADKTHIDYRIFGVPGSAYPDREDVAGCMEREYLRLADGTQLPQINGGYEPVPAEIHEAVFVIPCIGNTLPGKAPENWELPLRFVPAPDDLTVMPVIELSPSPQPSLASGDADSGTPAAQADSPVTVNKVIETSDGYILIGQFQPIVQPGESFQQIGALEIRDASGKSVSYTYPLDVNDEINTASGGMPGAGWAAQFKAAGLVYPLTISFKGANIYPADPNATAEFAFDAGASPQPGQVWDFNQDIQIAGHSVTLVSITVNSRGGYSFLFQAPPEVYTAGVQIAGYTAIGGGGGMSTGQFNTNLSFTELPTGLLTITVSNLLLTGDPVTWQGQWSPATPRTDLPANPTPQPGLCLTVDSLAQLQPLPPEYFNGKALLYEKLETGTWGLAVYSLDGSRKQVAAPSGNWGSLSPDGSQVAYSGSDNGIHIVDLASQTEKILPGMGGFNLHWSPDGTQIAYVGMGTGVVNSVFVISTDGTQAQASQLSDLSYAGIIGWTPDGLLYFVAPYTGGAAWKVYSYDFAGGTAQERFTIENGTPKYLNPKLSPDGNWIAYRGRDNSSLYLVRTDGSDMHLVLDNLGAVGIEWGGSGWLGVSLSKANSDESTLIIIRPESCEGYVLPEALHGELEGLFIP